MRFVIVMLLAGLWGCSAGVGAAVDREPIGGNITLSMKTNPSEVDSGGHRVMAEDRPAWDDEFARELEGSLIIIGLTYLEPAGEQLRQLYGTVVKAHPHDGVVVRLEGSRSGEFYYLPPDLRSYEPAPPGEYRLRETGEVVVDPDFTTTWEVTRPTN